MNNTNYKKMLYDELIREYNIYKEQLKSDIITYYGKFYFIITKDRVIHYVEEPYEITDFVDNFTYDDILYIKQSPGDDCVTDEDIPYYIDSKNGILSNIDNYTQYMKSIKQEYEAIELTNIDVN